MFGYPGGAILPVFDELYKTPAKFILNRHEQGSGHCADGYARATGKPGVCIVTSGPARPTPSPRWRPRRWTRSRSSSSAARSPTKVIGNDAFQEADVTGITRPCTKWNYLVKDVRELPRIINEAFLIATSGRPGPVLVDLPKDVTSGICTEEVGRHAARAHREAPQASRRIGGTCEAGAWPPRVDQRRRKARFSTSAAARSSPARGRRCASSPIRPISPARPRCWAWARLTRHDPKASTCSACTAALTRTTPCRNRDCLIAVGARFDDRVTGNLATFAPNAKIIHIDIDPSSIGKNVDVDVPVVGDARVSLEAILAAHGASRSQGMVRPDQRLEKAISVQVFRR